MDFESTIPLYIVLVFWSLFYDNYRFVIQRFIEKFTREM